MFDHLIAPLRDALSPHFNLCKTRLEAMAAIMSGLPNCRTVNLTHLAAHLPGKALYKSKYRRLQHFFKKVHFDQPAVAGFIMRLLNQKGAIHLALDRTNWKLGKAHINILVLALVTRKFRIPIMWLHVGHGGNSSTEQRIELMNQYIDEFGVDSIQSLLADREFVGDDWFTYHVEKKYLLLFACARTCILKPKTENKSSFLHSFAKGVKDNGKAGYAAWTGHRKIYCGSK